MKILMCQPDFFGIKYEINSWMHMTNQVDKTFALKQWSNLKEVLTNLGAEVELIQPQPDLPDMTFTANAGIPKNNTFISANNRHKERKGEEKFFQEWFSDHSYTIKELKHYQGGEGEALWYRDKLYMGYGFRSDIESHKEVADILGVETISLRLIDSYFYDLDTAFCPLGNLGLLYYPDAFSEETKQLLSSLPNTLAVNSAEAREFICNSLVVNNTLICEFEDEKISAFAKRLGLKQVFVDCREFKKSGGGIKCLSLIL